MTSNSNPNIGGKARMAPKVAPPKATASRKPPRRKAEKKS